VEDIGSAEVSWFEEVQALRKMGFEELGLVEGIAEMVRLGEVVVQQ